MHTNLFAKNRKLHNLQLPILYIISIKSIISDMHHPAIYVYINFQQNQASRSFMVDRLSLSHLSQNRANKSI